MPAIKEYQTVTSISGPLMLVEMVDEAKYGHIVDIELGDGSIRHGQILQVENDKVLVQVFEGTRGIDVTKSTVRFLAKPLELAVSPDILGRVLVVLASRKTMAPPSFPINVWILTASRLIRMPAIIRTNLSRPAYLQLTA